MAKEKIDYSYNIFENVSKEQFIEEGNSAKVGLSNFKGYSVVGNDFSIDRVHFFKYVNFSIKKEVDLVVDILNYEDEVNFFNSFKPVTKLNGKNYIIVDNINKYYEARNKDIITKYHSHFYIKSYNTLVRLINKEKKAIISDTLEDEMNSLFLKKSEEINRKLNDSILDFNDYNKFGVTISPKIHFRNYGKHQDKKMFTKEHLTNDVLFDEFIVYNIHKLKVKESKYYDGVFEEIIEEFKESLEIFGEYIGYIFEEKSIYGYSGSDSMCTVFEFKKIK